MSHQTPVTGAEGSSGGDSSLKFDLEEWNAFKKTHKKNYETEEEEQKRIKIFMETKENIAKHNIQYEKGLVTFKMGINQFADMTPEEKKRCC